MNVSIDWDCRAFESVDQYAVGGFSAYRGKLQQFFHVVWNFAFVFLKDYPGYSLDSLGLGVVEAYGFDEPSDRTRVCLGELGGAGILGEEA